ncbi:oligopeptide/dipeptide ABC transporter ATP-binding protein [Rhizobium skierniewicense]|uniref:Oligopeptide/dipeptide ABC transporter ATP-binding protein n=1 Tax=Rhizobium skierniewicense TaxID=984260 RepID=A0A7W6G3Q9_9HYPH|nr:ABC transporter ATP-binding protein [Rhizobium skierniewicense]MBB3948468.1 oligopeptide/dipeptide ABC transporter ATP-binding protein [Rhizobium skierniewicense]NTF33457.1 ABC transporter ATP-binding protein [Rhizobium skierniewicense]
MTMMAEMTTTLTPDRGVTLFELLDVQKLYEVRRSDRFWNREMRSLTALDGVRLRIDQGVSMALVGESGSGKSTLLRVLLGLAEPSQGLALYRGKPVTAMRAAGTDFAREVSMVYQDARASLNPRMTVGQLIAEPLRHFNICPKEEIGERVASLLARVGLATDLAGRYPAAMSGGQIRRVAIARALASNPMVLVADEAVSGLDVSTQAQLLNLLRKLRREMNLTLVFITHDLGVASYLCDEIAIMYLGRIVETGPTKEVLANPAHPYSRALRHSAPEFFEPISDPLPGEIPSPLDLPPGCRFAGRCTIVQSDCLTEDPVLMRQTHQRSAACYHPLSRADEV